MSIARVIFLAHRNLAILLVAPYLGSRSELVLCQSFAPSLEVSHIHSDHLLLAVALASVNRRWSERTWLYCPLRSGQITDMLPALSFAMSVEDSHVQIKNSDWTKGRTK